MSYDRDDPYIRPKSITVEEITAELEDARRQLAAAEADFRAIRFPIPAGDTELIKAHEQVSFRISGWQKQIAHLRRRLEMAKRTEAGAPELHGFRLALEPPAITLIHRTN